ncbi:MAPEG family protein [Bradyrhizobium sp. th.b2]|uniref:MAPEG family protein n=1 Tax=Bradyrhizobium sp. th-b2 TaxID=172088 RepID=UPI00041EA204|nr:MAPEG family protein [Bradyrhizobium sp. th.b2]
MTDLQWLAATILLTLLGALPYVLQRIVTIGLPRTLGNPRATDAAEVTPWAQRARSAHANAVENLVAFAPALIAAHLHSPQAPILVTAAQVYFFARLVHYLVYAAGVPVIRTLAYFVSLGATLAVLSTLLA